MFVGHLAVALAAKRAAPRVSLGWFVGASFGLDLLWPVLLLTGVERVVIDPGNTAFTPLDFQSYPWSHSLLMVVLWAVLLGALARRRLNSLRGAVVVAALVVSHWVLDWMTHRPDLPLWPSGPVAGLGLWNSVVGTVVVEGAMFAAGIAAYTSITRATSRVGTWAFVGLIALTGTIWISGPWSAPPPGATAIAVVGLAMWLFPVWAAWIDRHRSSVDRRD
jgi:membrane-bound metal-dependent hydrolase YbcI (DUF457 family)